MTTPPSNRRQSLLLGLGFILLALAAYSSAIAGGFIWDDDSYVTANLNLESAEGLERIWFEPSASPQYYPLVFTSFWIERQLWGRAADGSHDATGYHGINVLVHALSAILLWRLLERLRVPGALFAGLLFLLHPVCVESVAWITERKNVLSMFFMLASATAWFRFRPPGGEGEEEEPAGAFGWFLLALGLFACALLSKTVTACLPAAILLVQWWRRGTIRMRDVGFLLPMFVAGALLGVYTSHLEVTQVGAQGPEWDHSFLERLLIAGRVPWFYLGKLLVPYPLAFFYTRWDIDTGVWWQYLFPVAAGGLVVLLLVLRTRIGRGPLTAALFFGGFLLPSSGLFDLFPHRYSFVADHFQYHALLGPLVLLAAGGTRLFSSAGRRAAGLGCAAVALLACGALTWRQGLVYRDVESLWQDTVEKTPTSWAALLQLGQIRFQGGKRDEGLALLERAVQYAPAVSEAQMSLAHARAETGDVEGALALYGEILSRRPAAVRDMADFALALYQRGGKADGVRLLEGLHRLAPRSAHVKLRLGSLYLLEGRNAEALSVLQAAVNIDPASAEAHVNLGSLFAKRGDWDQAVFHFRATVRLQPDFPGAQRKLQAALLRQQGGR